MSPSTPIPEPPRVACAIRSRRRVGALCALLLGLSLLAPGAAGAAGSGSARFLGSPAGTNLSRPVVGIAATPSGNGYWLVASDGGIFTYGDAHFYGSTGAIHLNQPIVGMAATPTGRGYWLVASDGGIFTYGDAHFSGSLGTHPPAAPVAGIARDRSGRGYVLVDGFGTTSAFGPGLAALGAAHAGIGGVVGIAAAAGGGVWFVTAGGAVESVSATGAFSADPNDPATRLDAIAQNLVTRINAERARRGLHALTWDPVLGSLAAFWAQRMGASGSLHHSNIGGLFGVPMYASRYRELKENIFTGGGMYATAGGAHVGFMHSTPHRDALLDPSLTSVATGAWCAGGTLWVTEEFGVWASAPAPAPAPATTQDPIAVPDLGGPHC
jgi:hypothetical protein